VSTNAGDAGPTAVVTAENWRQPPHNRWTFWHVGDILPTHRIPAPDRARMLSPAIGHAADIDVTGVGLVRTDGRESTLGEVLADTFTDALVVLQDGALVTEWYGDAGAPGRTHALMSVTKSVVGCVTAALVDRGLLDPDQPVTDFVPELAGSGYAGATVRHLLDMRSGVRFLEDYTDPDADVCRIGESVGGIYGYLCGLAAEAPHGQRFGYRSAETDALGWVCERAAGRAMAELIRSLIWQPMGAEFDAEIMCDTVNTAWHDGGLCATARDMARFGQMLLDGGTVPAGDGVATVLGPKWLRAAWAVDADIRSAFAASPNEASMPGGWYRDQFWFRPGSFGDVLLCLGIHGQMIHVSRRTSTVCVKFSTWPQPQNPGYLQDTLRAFDNLGGALGGRHGGTGRHRLPGIVSGVHRHGAADRPDEFDEN
jgi:CubicO group peptidase (beta-lactamase class C family)